MGNYKECPILPPDSHKTQTWVLTWVPVSVPETNCTHTWAAIGNYGYYVTGLSKTAGSSRSSVQYKLLDSQHASPGLLRNTWDLPRRCWWLNQTLGSTSMERSRGAGSTAHTVARPAKRKHLGEMLVLSEVRSQGGKMARCSGQPPHPVLVLSISE